MTLQNIWNFLIGAPPELLGRETARRVWEVLFTQGGEPGRRLVRKNYKKLAGSVDMLGDFIVRTVLVPTADATIEGAERMEREWSEPLFQVKIFLTPYDAAVASTAFKRARDPNADTSEIFPGCLLGWLVNDYQQMRPVAFKKAGKFVERGLWRVELVTPAPLPQHYQYLLAVE